MSAVREQGSLPPPLRDTHAWKGNVYEDEVGAKAASPLAEEIGKSFSGNERNKMFFSCQGKEFKDVSAIGRLDDPSDGRVLSLWDYDRDGRQDFAVVNSNAPWLLLYHNQVPAAGKVVAVRFVGGNAGATATQNLSPRDGFGAKVKVKAGGLELLREFRCGEGMAAQNSSTLLVGIGANELADTVTVLWPSGGSQEIRNVKAGNVLTFYEQPARITQEPYLVSPPGKPAEPARSPLAKLVFPQLDGVDKANKGLRLYTSMATWCAACKTHTPELRQLRDSFAPEALRMYGLPVDEADDAKMLNEFMQEFDPPYALLSNTNAQQMKKTKQLLKDAGALEALPSTVVTDARGRILLAIPGLPTVSQLRALQ